MTAGSKGPRPSDRFIPWYIALFFAVQAVLFGWFTYIAEKTHTGVVTDQAYEKGLAYNGIIEKSRAQEAMGFKSEIKIRAGKIVFLLRDREGNPVSAAKVTGILFRPVHDGIDMSFDMKGDRGFYAVALPFPEQGLWEVRIRAVTDKGAYQTSQRIMVE